MRSIEIALAADYARRGLWIIPVVLLTIVALPVWLFTAFRYDGALAADSREAVALHVTLTLMMGFGAAIAVFQAQGKLARHFIRPISSARLVACQMALGLGTIVAMYTIAAGVLNLGGARWPVIGPAMFLAATLACALAVIWSLEGSVFGQLIGCIATTLPMTYWFHRCYGATLLGEWDRMWQNPTAGEALMLGSITLAALGVAVLGVSRTRRGDVWDFAALRQWWERQSAARSTACAFASAAAAQAWCEWRQKFGILPAVFVVCFLLFLQSLWAYGFVETREMLEIARNLPLVILMLVMPMIFGLVAGNCGRESGRTNMRFVLATRPVTDTFLGLAILRNCAAGLLTSWGTWLVMMAGVYGLTYWVGYREEVRQAIWPEGMTLQQYAALAFIFVLISWTFTALMAGAVATGRSWLLIAMLVTFFSLLLVFALLKTYLREDHFAQVLAGWYAVSGTAFLLGTAAAFVAAVRTHLMTTSAAVVCLAAWLVISGVALSSSTMYTAHLPARDWAFLWQCLGWLALSILPFAAMPLAIRWNRHR